MDLKNTKPTSVERKLIHARTIVILAIVFAAAALRIVPHPMNFAPIGVLALFGGAYFSSKRAAFVVPLLSLMAGDVFIGFHRLIPYVYASFIMSVAIGLCLRKRRSLPRVGTATLAGIPYFWNTLAGDAFYVALLFGCMALAESRFHSLRESALATGMNE